MTFDKRLTPARADLAAAHLQGVVAAPRYVEGRVMQIAEPVADLRATPSPDAGLDTQLLAGETVTVYEEHEGWAWVQAARDSYVGYMSSAALRAPQNLTHRVAVRSTFIYPLANMKTPILGALPLGAEVAVAQTSGDFAQLTSGGFVFARHLKPIGRDEDDFVAVAESLIGAPYLWGGKSPAGIDCSGLVQTALFMAGRAAPRDTDMQLAGLGAPVAAAHDLSGLQRGDLIFWKGHVGVMQDAHRLLHANGHHMLVASEPLLEARARIAQNSFGAITGVRRLQLDV
ncbi:MAG: C40 family peptidase [Hyphomicrobiales bacterium]|nr:C40 family peptidase [Hyphomicrobiales bacterium]